MNTLELSILIYVSLSLKMLVMAILVIAYRMKLISSGGARKARSRGMKRGTTASQETNKAMSSEIQGPRQSVPKTDGAVPSPRRVITGSIERAESGKQAQTKNTARIVKLEPRLASAGATGVKTSAIGQKRSVTPARQAQPSGTDGGQKKRIVIMSPASRNKVEEQAEPGGTAKQINTGASAPIEPLAEKEKKDEAGTDNVTVAGGNKPRLETPTEIEASGQNDEEDDKSGMGDLSDLFATSASEFAEKNILSEQVEEVDINVVLQEGLGLLDQVKKREK